MSDRMFASGGDPVYGGHPMSGRAPYREGGQHQPTQQQPSAQQPSAEDPSVGVVRRLQARLDRHLRLLDQLYPEPPQLRELRLTARGMRRDTESLVLLNGDDPGGQSGGPRRLSDVLDDAAAAAEETWRILVRPAAGATVEAGASVELLHVLAEALDHVTAAYPDAGIDVASYVEEGRGLTIEVSVNSASRHAPDGLGTRRAAATAEAHARRSRSGLFLTLPATAPPSGTGVVVAISCPVTAITIDGPAWSVVTAGRQPLPSITPAAMNGNGWAAEHGGNGYVRATAAGFDQQATMDYSPSASSHVDELFGPMVDLPRQSSADTDGTPIFEAIASAWFREEQQVQQRSASAERPLTDPLDWETPADIEWREASARVSQPDPLPTTPSGLPRRRPGNQLVPPPRSRPDAGHEPADREPDKVRNRLSTYQRGLRQGRHRAPGPDAERW